jgi:DNA-binding NarL/FixJ family response regulator
MSGEIKIIIADDHAIFREGLKSIISADQSIKILGDAANGNDALMLINKLEPEIAVLDVDMPVKNGLEVIRELRKNNNPVKIIVLTMYKEERMVNNILDMNVMGYVLKESAINDIVDCIRSVSEGNYYISPLISNLLLKRKSRLEEMEEKTPALKDLTPTEMKILKLIAENKTSKEISEELFVNHRTIEKHRENIISKLNLQGSLSLVKFAIENKSIL